MLPRRILRWGIVLLLLAALPAMTVALAQGQEPSVKENSPEISEPGESQAPLANKSEVEPNGTRGLADYMDINDVMSGDMDFANDEDYFEFYVSKPNTTILIDTDARSMGSSMDTEITLYDSSGNVIGYDDDIEGNSNGRDSLLYRVLDVGWWFVKVEDYDGSSGQQYRYNLIVSSPLIISAAAANLGTGNVAGIPFQAQDILAWSDLNDGQEKWVMLLDGSDVGFTKNVMNLSRGWGSNQPGLIVGFAANVSLTDNADILRTFKPWDWATFDLQEAGLSSTIGVVEYHPGVDHGLSTSSEKMDAISVEDYYTHPAQRIDVYLSTTGTATVPRSGGTLKVLDEDMYRSRVAVGVAGWTNTDFFDGSKVAGLGIEDIYAASYYEPSNDMYITILGTGRVGGVAVTQKDIFRIDLPGHTWGGIVWHGPDHGWNYNIDAFDYPGGW